MRKLGITGANGFVGKNLERSFANKFDVKCFSRYKNANQLDNSKFFNFYLDQSIKNLDLVGLDSIIHLAGDSSFKKNASIKDFEERNLSSSLWLLERSAECGVKRFIYLSSIKVHGEKSLEPLSSKSLTAPKDHYSYCKLKSEEIIRETCAKKDIDFAIVRSPIIYGLGMKGNLINLFKIIKYGFPLPFKNINNKRSFLYIKNLEEALLKIVEFDGKISKTFTLSDPEAVSTSELISIICNCFAVNNKTFKVSETTIRNISNIFGMSNVMSKFLDSLEVSNEEFRNFFNWEPEIKTAEGIKYTIDSIYADKNI